MSALLQELQAVGGVTLRGDAPQSPLSRLKQDGESGFALLLAALASMSQSSGTPPELAALEADSALSLAGEVGLNGPVAVTGSSADPGELLARLSEFLAERLISDEIPLSPELQKLFQQLGVDVTALKNLSQDDIAVTLRQILAPRGSPDDDDLAAIREALQGHVGRSQTVMTEARGPVGWRQAEKAGSPQTVESLLSQQADSSKGGLAGQLMANLNGTIEAVSATEPVPMALADKLAVQLAEAFVRSGASKPVDGLSFEAIPLTKDAVPAVAGPDSGQLTSDMAEMAWRPPVNLGNEVAPVVQTDALAVPERPAVEVLSQVVVRNVRYLVSEGGETITVKLVPESLGEMRLEISSVNGALTVRIAAANPQVRMALEGQLGMLRQALAVDGHQVGEISVAAEPALGQPSHGQAGQQQAQPQAGQTRQGTGFSWRNNHPDGQEAYQRPPTQQGALDLWV